MVHHLLSLEEVHQGSLELSIVRNAFPVLSLIEKEKEDDEEEE